MQQQVTTRAAVTADVPAIAAGIAELLLEIGGKPAAAELLEAEARELIADPAAGAVLVAESAGGEIVGVLGASWQRAIRVPGRYGLIQELWVARAQRSSGVGARLLEALELLARERGIGRLEVGLPGERFAQLGATEAFYRSNGFEPVGLRMRRLL